MRPNLPPGFRPTPPPNPQIGRAIPTNEEGVPAGVRHARETLILADHPFANTDALETAGLPPLGNLDHYDGTQFYFVTNENHSGEPYLNGHYSFSLDHWEGAPVGGIEGTGVANPDAEASARFIVSILNINFGMAHGVPYNGRSITTANWPWSRAIAEQVLYNGTLRWAVTIERGYPAGLGVNVPPTGGPFQAAADPIWDIPAAGPNTETQALIGYTARIFTPGERGYDMLPARFGLNRAVMPLGASPLVGNVVIAPYEVGNFS